MPVLAAVAIGFTLFSVKRMTPPVVHADPPAAPPSAAYAKQIGAVGLVESSTENIGVSVPVAGMVTRVAVKAGDNVERGQLLFSLDDRDLRAELALQKTNLELEKAKLERLENSPRPEEIPPAQARVDEAQAQLEDAKVQLRVLEAVKDPRAVRQEDLLRRRRAVETAQARLEQAAANLRLLKAGTWKADLEVARAEVKQAESRVARIEADLGRLAVTSPITGQILQCKVRPGEYAPSGVLAQPLILLGQVKQKHIRADIDEKDAWRFRAGAKATGSVRGNASIQYALGFVRVEPYVIPKKNLTGDSTERVDSRVLQVIYSLPDRNDLYIGQQMDLSIEAVK